MKKRNNVGESRERERMSKRERNENQFSKIYLDKLTLSFFVIIPN